MNSDSNMNWTIAVWLLITWYEVATNPTNGNPPLQDLPTLPVADSNVGVQTTSSSSLQPAKPLLDKASTLPGGMTYDALVRSSYVLGGVCLLALVYLALRTLRLRRRRASGRRSTGSRKYQPLNRLASHQHQQEISPLGRQLDDDEEDDDVEDTLFETSVSLKEQP